MFGCGIFIYLQKAFDICIIKFTYRNWNTIVFGDVLLSGLGQILLIESSMFPFMVVMLTYLQYHKALYSHHYFFSLTLMICQMFLRNEILNGP